MNGLIKQLRVSLLVVLGISAVDLVTRTLLPPLAVALTWGGARRGGAAADIARNTALLFGIVALLPQILAGALLVTFA